MSGGITYEKRKPVFIGPKTIAHINLYHSQTGSILDMAMKFWEEDEEVKRESFSYDDAAKEFISQFEDYASPAFLEALKRASQEAVDKHWEEVERMKIEQQKHG